MVKQGKHFYEFGPFRLIPEERLLLRDNQLVPLSPKSFDLLTVLVENSGHLITKDELMRRLWPDSFVEEANLSVKMSTLRRALGEGPDENLYVETVPRHGYRFVARVREHWETGADAAVSPSLPTGDGSATLSTGETSRRSAPPNRAVADGRWLLAPAALVLVTVVLLAVNAGGLRERLFGDRSPVRIRSVAVLPLTTVSGEADDYLAEGITDALISDLATIDVLRVASRPAVMRYKGASKPVTEIGRELNVDALLTGRVARSGERLRISIQLVHSTGDRIVWAESYERPLRDVLVMQKEIIDDIVDEIGIKVTPREPAQFGKISPIIPEAYDNYLRGRYYAHRQTREDNEAAIRALEQAVAADPNFAAAFAELSQVYVWKLFLFAPGDRKWEEKAFMAAEKALSLDPNLAVAYLARGRLLWTPVNNFPHERAIGEYRRALSLNPHLDEAHNQLALVYCHIGAFDEALQESKKALSINPGNHLARFRAAQTLNFQSKFEEALAVLKALPQEVNPALVGHQTVWALFNLGRKDEASAKLEELLRDYPEDEGGLFTSLQAMLAASAGQERQAGQKIRSAIEKGRGFGHFHHTAYHIASAYALLDKPQPAVKWLELAADDGFPCYPLFEKDSNLDNLRGDPEFLKLIERLKKQSENYRFD